MLPLLLMLPLLTHRARRHQAASAIDSMDSVADLCGNRHLESDFMNTFCETKAFGNLSIKASGNV